MAKYVYGKRDTKTVKSIYDRDTMGEKAIWNFANSLGVNIVRVRKDKERNETTVGDTFLGYMLVKFQSINKEVILQNLCTL